MLRRRERAIGDVESAGFDGSVSSNDGLEENAVTKMLFPFHGDDEGEEAEGGIWMDDETL